MAQLALAAVFAAGGAGIAGAAGGSVLLGAQLGFSLGNAVGAQLFAETTKFEGPRLEDLRVMESNYGMPIPKLWGQGRISGRLIWSSDLIETRHRNRQSGGSGPSGGTSSTTYTYSVDCAVAVCEGPIVGIKRIWANGIVIFDTEARPIYDEAILPNGVRVFSGTEGQTPSSLQESYEGIGNVPAYRGTCYVEFEGMQLAKFGNRLPNLTFEVFASPGNNREEKFRIPYNGTNVSKGFLLTNTHYVITYKHEMWFINRVTGTVDATIPLDSVLDDPIVQGIGPNARYVAVLGGPNSTRLFVVDTVTYAVTNFPVQFISHCVKMDPISNTVWVYTTGSGGRVMRYGIPYGGLLEIRPLPNLGVLVDIAVDRDGVIWSVGKLWTSLASNFTIRSSHLEEVEQWVYEGEVIFSEPVSVVTDYLVEGYGFSQFVDYDLHRHSLVILSRNNNTNEGWLLEWSIASKSVVQAHPVKMPQVQERAWRDTAFPGRWWVEGITEGTTAHIYSIDLFSGQIALDITYPAVDWNIGQMVGAGFGVYTYDQAGGGSGSGPANDAVINFWSATGPVPLSQIVGETCIASGLDSGDINVSDLTQLVRGYVRPRPMSARAVIEPLQRAFWFDGAETDYKLVFRNRGGASIRQISLEEMIPTENAGPLEIRRVSELEIPKEVRVRYIDLDSDYDASMQYDRRMAVGSDEIVELDLPLVLLPTEAKQVAEVNLTAGWMARTNIRFPTTINHIALDPTDIINIPIEGSTTTVRLTNFLTGSHRVILEGVLEDATNYVPVKAGAKPAPPKQQAPTPFPTIAHTQLFLLDLPPLRDKDNYLLMYVAAGGDGFGEWPGGELYKSEDGGTTYAFQDDFFDEVTYGTLTAPMSGTGPGNVFDWANTIQVQLLVGELSSASELAVLNGANAIVINGEIIQFRIATETSARKYTLSGLLRARKGTDYAMAAHATGSPFVVLTNTTILAQQLPFADIGTTRHYKGVTYGHSLDQEQEEVLTLQGNSVRPLSPVHLNGTWNESGDIIIEWIRRARINAEWRNEMDVPLDEPNEFYFIEYLDGPDGDMVDGEFVVNATTYTFIEADQTLFFGSPQTTLHVRILQLGANGFGHVALATFTA